MQMFQNKFQTLTRQNLLQVSRSKETQNTVKVLYIVLVLVLLLQNNKYQTCWTIAMGLGWGNQNLKFHQKNKKSPYVFLQIIFKQNISMFDYTDKWLRVKLHSNN